MKKSLYICNANNSNKENIHTKNTALSVFSGVTSVLRCGLFAKHIQGVRSLFVHTRKTCYTMRTTNKQATKAKNSNLLRDSIIYALAGVGLPLLIAEADSTVILILSKVVGASCLLLASGLFYGRNGNDMSKFKNEYNHNDVR